MGTADMGRYRNLVLKGGGVRGIAYLGALESLAKHRVLGDIQRVAGSSVGAITAVLAALYPSFDDIKTIADSLDYTLVPSSGMPAKEKESPSEKQFLVIRPILEKIEPLMGNVQNLRRLVQNYGWYSSDYVYRWLQNNIAPQFTVKKEAYTFADFRDPSIHRDRRPFKDLYVTGTDISHRRIRVFSYETTPDMEVAYAVRISMSIPFFFEALPYQYPGDGETHQWADGGVLWNFPLTLFDDPQYNRKSSGGINPETLGLFLFTSPEHTDYDRIDTMMDYMNALFDSLLLVQDQLILYNEQNKERVIFIDDTGVPTKEFNIQPGDGTYQRLYDSGYGATEDFFSQRARWDDIIRRIQNRFGWKVSTYQ